METIPQGKRFAAIIAAGGKAPEPVQRREGVQSKGEILVGRQACVSRVATAVTEAGLTGAVVGGITVRELGAPLLWVEEQHTAIQNFRAGVEATDATHLVFLPCDAPFLTAPCLAAFVEQLGREQGDFLAVGLTSAGEYQSAFPECPKASVRIREGRFHTGALYGGTREAFLQALDTLEGLFLDRRSQFAMAKRIGIWQAVKFGLGKLTLSEASLAFERVLGIRGVAVMGCEPGMVPDIDDLTELDQIRSAERRLRG